MLFTDEKSGRNLGMLLKMSRDEKDFLVAEARRRGISKVALIRMCLRKELMPQTEQSQPKKRRSKNNVGNQT